MHYPANYFPGQTQALEDNTHFTPYGATALAHCIIYSIRQQGGALAGFLQKGIPLYTPSQPLPWEKFYWTLSWFVTGKKPDGN